MIDVDVDVAVVGAGPVGLVLGIQLAQRGRSVVLLEQHPHPYTLPRAVHFDHEVGRILQSCRLGDALRAVTEPAATYEWRNATGTTLLEFGRAGAAWQRHARQPYQRQQAHQHANEAEKQERDRLGVRHAVLGHDKARAPDQHE